MREEKQHWKLFFAYESKENIDQVITQSQNRDINVQLRFNRMGLQEIDSLESALADHPALQNALTTLTVVSENGRLPESYIWKYLECMFKLNLNRYNYFEVISIRLYILAMLYQMYSAWRSTRQD